MNHTSLFILGRQPALGRAELESVLGREAIERIGDHAVASTRALQAVPFERLGGVVRLAKPLDIVPSTKWSEITAYLTRELPKRLGSLPEGKLKLGLSVYDLPVTARHLLRTGLELKKACKSIGRTVRVVPNTELELNTAQVLHNQLTGELGMELLFVRFGDNTYLAQTVTVQNIEAYAARDQGRPKRDAFVGMLPPKLAQTIINLAAGPLPADSGHTILDPFCGTGVVLQEARLMGYSVYGSDLSEKMVDYSTKNVVEWLPKAYPDLSGQVIIEPGDATDHQWRQAHINAVACETYLGRPLSAWPSSDKLHEIIGTCNVIIEKFLRNLNPQITSGTRLCLAVPCWRAPDGQLKHLPLLDRTADLGYNRVSFALADEKELVYYRPDQIVARELLVITRK